MYDAIVLAGGTARRLGGVDKPTLDVGGSSLLDRAVAAAFGAQRVIVVGPARQVVGKVSWCREQPPGGGPVAAIAAGFAHTGSELVLVLAADLPWVAPAVPLLLDALSSCSADVSLLADPTGRVNRLAAAWRRGSLATALATVGDPAGVPVRTLLAGAEQVIVPDTDGWGRDCDTWDDLSEARALAERNP